MRAATAVTLAVLGLLWGCGEIEKVVLPVRPSQTKFTGVQDLLIESGCSAQTGCHAVVVGNFQVTPAPKSRGQFEAEYLLTKDFHINLEAPERSKLLTVSLQGHPENIGHAACFSSVCSCTYQAVYAWIADRSFVADEPCPDECLEDSCL